jgi:hypothetical protein
MTIMVSGANPVGVVRICIDCIQQIELISRVNVELPIGRVDNVPSHQHQMRLERTIDEVTSFAPHRSLTGRPEVWITYMGNPDRTHSHRPHLARFTAGLGLSILRGQWPHTYSMLAQRWVDFHRASHLGSKFF